MSHMRMAFKKVDPDAPTPRYAHDGDAGFDLCSMEDVTLAPGETRLVGTGIAVAIPEGYVGMLFPRSGLGARGLTLSNSVGIVDSGYRGEVKAALHNNHPTQVMSRDEHGNPYYTQSDHEMAVSKGDRVCQMLVMPVERVDLVETVVLDDTDRGEGGFGSSGVGGRV